MVQTNFGLKSWKVVIKIFFICVYINSQGKSQRDNSWPGHEACGTSDSFANHRQPRFELLAGNLKTRMITFKDQNLSHKKQRGRIIDGEISNENAWPWQVSIQLNVSELVEVGHWCGGVLIHPSWVLTAAHCLKNDLLHGLDELNWSIHLEASSDLNKPGIAVDDVIIHPDYDNYQNDIALLHLESSLSSSPSVCLPSTLLTQNETFLGIRCIATGWGQTKLGGPLQDKLHQVELTVVENRHCNLVYGVMYNIPVGQNHLCAGPILAGGKGTCVGDSGGPLHCNMRDGRWYLAGITSFGSGCAKPGFPDVFTRITSYNKWIRETTREKDIDVK